jgi:hypothetical protein
MIKIKTIIISAMILFVIKTNAQEDSIHYDLEEVVFIDKKTYNSSTINLSNQDFKKLAGSFDDPSRVLLKYPGFSNVNDQANGIVYHGLPSHFFSWQLNQFDIVNPNHLSNAGTLSDISSTAAGGVNMFSGNVLSSYKFSTALNAEKKLLNLGGASDLRINGLDHSYAQFSLLGVEAGLNHKKEKHHFFTNYRYSFTGLLNNLGVEFGDEKISFSDLVVGYKNEGKKNQLALTLAVGNSENIHDKITDLPLTSFKDLLDINYGSDIWIIQAKNTTSLSNGKVLTLGASYSGKIDKRTSSGIFNHNNGFQYKNNENVEFLESKFSFIQEIKLKNNLELGLRETVNYNQYVYNTGGLNIKEFTTLIWLPYVNYEKKFNKNLGLKTQISTMFIDKIIKQSTKFIDKITPTPVVELYYQNSKNIVKASVGMSGQTFDNSFRKENQTANSRNANLEYKHTNKKFNASIQAFYHDIDGLPAGREYDLPARAEYFNAINSSDYVEIINSTQSGQAYSKGISIQAEYFGTKDLWININQTLFDLKYRNKYIAEWSNTENSFGYTGSMSAGKDFKKKERKISISTSYYMRGGQYYFEGYAYPFNRDKNYEKPIQNQLGAYSRLDLRVSYSKRKTMISLDIQNALNKLNDSYPYFDIDGFVVRKQLGLLPVLTYRRQLSM